MFTLNLQNKSLDLGLAKFIRGIKAHFESYSKQAYSKARRNYSYRLYKDLNSSLIEEYYTRGEYKKFKGYRLLAVDGSKLRLPNSPEIVEEFGRANKCGQNTPISMSSVSYDVMNEIVVHAELSKSNSNERELLKRHIEKEIESGCDIWIMDRGYPSLYLMAYFERHSKYYIMRVSETNFIKEVSNFAKAISDDSELVVDLESRLKKPKHKDLIEFINLGIKALRIRALKIKLDNGSIEYLITNIMQEAEFTAEDFKQIYKLRWNEEVYFNIQKNIVEIENFSGKTIETIKQDYFAKVFMLNIASLVAEDAQAIIDNETKTKKLKYEKYKVNKSLLIGMVDNLFIDLCNSRKFTSAYNYLVNFAARNKIPVIHGRYFLRKKKFGNKAFLFKRKVL